MDVFLETDRIVMRDFTPDDTELLVRQCGERRREVVRPSGGS